MAEQRQDLETDEHPIDTLLEYNQTWPKSVSGLFLLAYTFGDAPENARLY